MTRDELTTMIRDAISELAFETLRSGNKAKQAQEVQPKKKGLSEDELEYALFYGGNRPNKDGTTSTPITIKENHEGGIPKINSSDIAAFERGFEMILQEINGASVVFDKQSNGYTLKMWIGPSGIEAGASGSIHMGNKGVVKWAYSLQNGLTVTMDNLIVEKGNKNILEKLYSNYDSWQKEWREKLTVTSGSPIAGSDNFEGGLASQEEPPQSPQEELPV